MQGKGYTNEQIAQSQLELARGQGFEGVQPANEFVKAWTYFMAGELTGAGLAAVIGRFVLGGGAKAIGAAKPLVSEGSEVTAEVIQKALQGDPAISAQGAVSLPAVQRYVDRLIKGDVAPAIKMDGNVIVDGDHRYIAAKILGRNPDVTPGALSPNKVGQTKPVSELKVDQVDWGNK
jgi:filamentous hemagglutinin